MCVEHDEVGYDAAEYERATRPVFLGVSRPILVLYYTGDWF